MLARLDWMLVQPKQIVEVGLGVGELGEALCHRFAGATVQACTWDAALLEYAKKRWPSPHYLLTDPDGLPFADQSIDLMVANMVLPWWGDITALLQAWRRVLTPNGLLMCTALGIDTLQECHPHASQLTLLDMHDVGDAMLHAGLVDPVLDVSHVTLSYQDKARLQSELHASGMWQMNDDHALSEVTSLKVTYEIISAHAFTPLHEPQYQVASDGAVAIPLSHLRQKLRQGGKE